MQLHVHAPSLGTNILVFDAKTFVVALQGPLFYDVLRILILDAVARAREPAACSGLQIPILRRSRDLLAVLVTAANSPRRETSVLLSDVDKYLPLTLGWYSFMTSCLNFSV
jgi:hypothetical protein